MSGARSVALSDYEIRVEGWRALTERLGISGAIRFLTQYDPGRGNYVEERRELFADATFPELFERARRLSAPVSSPAGATDSLPENDRPQS